MVLERAGIPGAAGFMEVIIVLALLSAFNAQIYASSRMMHSLAARGEAPKFFTKTNAKGVPTNAIALSVALSVVMVILNYADTGWLLTFMLNAAGASLLIVWVFIAVSQLRLRRQLETIHPLPIRMWAFPYLTWFALAIFVALAVLMLSDASARVQLVSAAAMFAVLTVAGIINAKVRGISPTARLPLPDTAHASDAPRV